MLPAYFVRSHYNRNRVETHARVCALISAVIASRELGRSDLEAWYTRPLYEALTETEKYAELFVSPFTKSLGTLQVILAELTEFLGTGERKSSGSA